MTEHILTDEELMTITQTLFDGRSIHALRWPLVQQLQESHRLQAARIQELEKALETAALAARSYVRSRQ